MGKDSWGRRFSRTYSRKLDNYKLNTKMYAMYIFCVLLPIIVTNALVFGLVTSADRAEKERNLENVAEAVAYSMNSYIDSAVYITKDIYINRVIHNFLDKQYETLVDYYTAYEKLKSNYTLHTNLGQKNAKAIIYGDNETIINGSEFARISTVKDTDWYQYYKNSGRNLVLYYYFDYSKQKMYNVDTSRTLSVIRKLDLYGKKDCEKLIKLDLDYNRITRDIMKANYAEDVYVCDGDLVLFSNLGNVAGNKKFETLSPDILKQTRYKKEITLYSQELTVYVMEHQLNMVANMKRYAVIIVVLIMVNMLIPVFVMYGVSRSITNRIFILSRSFDKVKDEQFEEINVMGQDEIGQLMGNYNHMTVRIKELIQVVYKGKLEQQELNIAKQRAELLALHSQINPHFMFNALESIRMRSILKKEEETAEIIGKLAVLMRKSVNWGADNISIKDELEFAEAYLKLQQYRFGERLSYRFDVDENCLDFRVPKLTIVTFVENSCVHGIEAMSRDGWIFISVKKSPNGTLIIEIEDTGGGMDEEYLEALRERIDHGSMETVENSGSVGILNACIRLKNYNRGKTSIAVESEKGVGTTVSICIQETEEG